MCWHSSCVPSALSAWPSQAAPTPCGRRGVPHPPHLPNRHPCVTKRKSSILTNILTTPQILENLQNSNSNFEKHRSENYSSMTDTVTLTLTTFREKV